MSAGQPRLYHRVQNRLARFGHANGEFADRIIEAICEEIEGPT